jgi:hypothetical protein
MEARFQGCRQGNDSIVRPYVLLCLPASYRSTAFNYRRSDGVAGKVRGKT